MRKAYSIPNQGPQYQCMRPGLIPAAPRPVVVRVSMHAAWPAPAAPRPGTSHLSLAAANHEAKPDGHPGEQLESQLGLVQRPGGGGGGRQVDAHLEAKIVARGSEQEAGHREAGDRKGDPASKDSRTVCV